MIKSKLYFSDIVNLASQGESDFLEFKTSTAEILERTQKNKGWEDGIVKDITIEDFDHDQIIKTIQEGVSQGRIPPTKLTTNPLEALIGLQLMRNNFFINASVVLFAKEPARWLPQCRLRLARFKGDNKRDFIDNRQVEGNAFYLLEEGLTFVQRHLPIASHFESGKIERIDQPLIPIEALREVFVNAICHRDYRVIAGSISCSIYDDRLEIWNDGTLPEGFSFSELKSLHESRPRNPRIARALYCRKLFESWGSGIELISNLCKESGNPEPEFFKRSGGFCVLIPFKKSLAPVQIETTIPSAYKLNARQKEILEILNKAEALSVSEVHQQLSEEIGIRTVKADLSLLESYGLYPSHLKMRSIVK